MSWALKGGWVSLGREKAAVWQEVGAAWPKTEGRFFNLDLLRNRNRKLSILFGKT